MHRRQGLFVRASLSVTPASPDFFGKKNFYSAGYVRVPGVLDSKLHLVSIFSIRSENKKINENSLTYINAKKLVKEEDNKFRHSVNKDGIAERVSWHSFPSLASCIPWACTCCSAFCCSIDRTCSQDRGSSSGPICFPFNSIFPRLHQGKAEGISRCHSSIDSEAANPI